MSRHLVLNRPDRHVVIGFDHPLQSFFGQVFHGPAGDRSGQAIAGWPTRSGLGVRRPAISAAQVANDLSELGEWAKRQIAAEFDTEPQAAFHLGCLIGLLSREHVTGLDQLEVCLPPCLSGERA